MIVVDVARPDDGQVGESRIADPALLSVQDPFVAAALRGGGKSARRPRADLGLGQPEGADLFGARHRRQPTLPLLAGAAQVDRSHREAAVHAMEGRDRAVDAREFQHDQAVGDRAPARASEALVRRAGDAERAVGADELERKFRAAPIVVDDRGDLLLGECAHAAKQGLVLGPDRVRDPVEIPVDRRGRRRRLRGASRARRRRASCTVLR